MKKITSLRNSKILLNFTLIMLQNMESWFAEAKTLVDEQSAVPEFSSFSISQLKLGLKIEKQQLFNNNSNGMRH
jgi:hypothetical protein